MGQSIGQLLAHWDTTLELQVSPLSIYDAIEEVIISHALPNITMSRVEHREGGMFSAWREYLRVRRKNLIFDICAAPYGSGLIISWWLGLAAPGIFDLFAELPIVGSLIESWQHPATYYAIDTTSYFQRTIHNSILEVVDSLTENNRLQPLDATTRAPILHEYYEW